MISGLSPGTTIMRAKLLSAGAALGIIVALVVFVVWSRRAPEPLPALQFDQFRLTLQNQTDRTWADVEIWVNGHYRVQVPSLASKQVVMIPLDTFVAGFGQRFNGKKTAVFGVEVSTWDGARRRIEMVWGKGRGR